MKAHHLLKLAPRHENITCLTHYHVMKTYHLLN